MKKVKRPNREYAIILEEERLILDATEAICRVMDEQGVSRVELARRIGASKGHVSQLLDGGRNMTLRTLARLASALEHRAHVDIEPFAARADHLRPRQARELHEYFETARSSSRLKQTILSQLDAASIWADAELFTVAPDADVDVCLEETLARAA